MSETLSPQIEARVSYLLAEREDAGLRMRALRQRQADGERIFYLIEAESITQCEIRREMRALGVDTTVTFSR